MDKETFEILMEGEDLPTSVAGAPETTNQIFQLASIEWGCAAIEHLHRQPVSVLDCYTRMGQGAARYAELECVGAVTGIDPNPVKLQYARQNFRNPKLQYLHAWDVNDLERQIVPHSIDVALCFQTIEHVHDPVRFLQFLLQSLNDKDGVLLLASPTHQQPQFLNSSNPYHLIEYNRALLEELLSNFFYNVFFYEELPFKEALDSVIGQIKGNVKIPAGNYVYCSLPRPLLSEHNLDMLRQKFLLPLWAELIQSVQSQAIQQRTKLHFLAECYEKLNFESGFYSPELNHVWAKEKASLGVTVDEKAPCLLLSIRPAVREIAPDKPVNLTITLEHGPAKVIPLAELKTYHLAINLDPGPNRLLLEVDRTRVPAEDQGSLDTRRLGIQLSDIKFVAAGGGSTPERIGEQNKFEIATGLKKVYDGVVRLNFASAQEDEKTIVQNIAGALTDKVIRVLTKPAYFRLWEGRKIHITPNHYYQPIPDTRELTPQIWEKSSSLAGLNMNEPLQLKLLKEFSTKFRSEYDAFPKKPTDVPHQYYLNNRMFGTVDGEILYCMIRSYKPKRVLEFGSGFSTFLTAQAVLKNGEDDPAYQCELTTVDPHPNAAIKNGIPGLTRMLPVGAQAVPPEEVEKLGDNDVFFIDSSHVLRIGSDVQYEILELLPRLRKGVLVHIHDIFLPAEYSKKWVLEECRFWNEQYMLQAFMSFNSHFEVLWAGNYMHLKYPEKLKAAFKSYNQTPVGSFWIKKIK